MNFNASRNVGGIRKAKRVSDVNAMGAPSPTPTFPTHGYQPVPGYQPESGYQPAPGYQPTPGYQPATPQPSQPYHDPGITLDPQPAYSTIPNNNMNMLGAAMGAVSGVGVGNVGSVLQTQIVQDAALQYGQQLAEASRAAVHREVEKYVPISTLRYYFAVDTRYVLRKLLLIFFPFTHRDWAPKYAADSPVQPRYELNAPDLYIPAMAYVTYVLLAGFMMGVQQRFSPEQIGAQASRALAYIVLEMAVYVATLYVTNTQSSLRTLDLLAFSSYKYAAMIGCMLAGLVLRRTGYYVALVYTGCTLSYFLVKTLRMQVLAGGGGAGGAYGYAQPEPGGGTKRRVYFLLFVAVTQPLLSWWLTYDLVPSDLQLADLPLPAAL